MLVYGLKADFFPESEVELTPHGVPVAGSGTEDLEKLNLGRAKRSKGLLIEVDEVPCRIQAGLENLRNAVWNF